MNSNNFSISEAVSVGWQKVKENFLFFAAVMAIVWTLPFGIGFAKGFMQLDSTFYNTVFSIITWVFSFIVGMGIIKISLNVVDGKELKVEDLFSVTHLWLKYLLGVIVYGGITIIGFLLLIIPGIIFSVKYQYISYLIIDKEMDVFAALKKSEEITSGNKFHLWVLGLVLALINVLGILALFLGVFITIPLSWIATAYVYRKLSSNS